MNDTITGYWTVFDTTTGTTFNNDSLDKAYEKLKEQALKRKRRRHALKCIKSHYGEQERTPDYMNIKIEWS